MTTQSASIPPDFVEALKDALTHLYDITRLNDHPLAAWIPPDRLARGASHAHALRDLLIEAVERVNPGDHVSASARERRAFQVLQLRYVEAMPFREVMNALALSQTQYHREQRYAIETLASYLWDARRPRSPMPPPIADPASTLDDAETRAMSTFTDEVDIGAMLDEIVQLMAPVAARQGARLRATLASEPIAVTTSRTTLRHAIIGAISHMLEAAPGSEITLTAGRGAAAARVEVVADGLPLDATRGIAAESEHLRSARQLAESIGGRLESAAGRSGAVVLSLSAERFRLLVIDDNPDMVQLIGRYLADQPFSVLSAGSVDEGAAAALSARPDVILLDVMMPHRDGWDALQLLRHHPATADTPVVVCTVLGEQRLAEALGATAFLRKPLMRPELLRVLHEAVSRRSAPAGES